VSFVTRYFHIGDLATLLVLGCYALLVALTQPGSQTASLDRVLAAARERGVLRVATDIGFRPFSDLRDGQFIGYDIDLARAVGTKLGLEVAFVPTGFDGLYDTLTSGRADMIASALPYAPEFGNRARFSQFYFDAGQVLVVPVASPIQNTVDLAGQVVGVALGSDADSVARRLAATTSVLELRSSYEEPGAVLVALRRGEIQAAIVDNVAALSAIQGAGDLRIAQALTSEPYVLAVPPEAFQLHAALNQALEELRGEGLFEELNRKWFVGIRD
jgi:polar amino acid transport system substrate-binding protein